MNQARASKTREAVARVKKSHYNFKKAHRAYPAHLTREGLTADVVALFEEVQFYLGMKNCSPNSVTKKDERFGL